MATIYSAPGKVSDFKILDSGAHKNARFTPILQEGKLKFWKMQGLARNSCLQLGSHAFQTPSGSGDESREVSHLHRAPRPPTMLQGGHPAGPSQAGLRDLTVSGPPAQRRRGQLWSQVAGEGPHGGRMPLAPGVCSLAAQLWATGAGTVLDAGSSCRVGRTPANHAIRNGTDGPLSHGRESGALASSGWPAVTGLEVGPGSSVGQAAGQSRKESSVSRAGPLGASRAGQARPEQASRSWSHKQDIHSLVAGGTGEIMGSVTLFLQLGRLRHSPRLPLWAKKHSFLPSFPHLGSSH